MVKLNSWLVIMSLLVIVVILATACGTKRNLDETVDSLITTLQAGDYEKMKSLSAPSLQTDLTPEKFKRFSRVVKRLGQFKSRSMDGIEVNATSGSTGGYQLDFERGPVTLKITVLRSKIVTFNFTGKTVQEAMTAVRNERFANFAISGFQFLNSDLQPNPQGAIYPLGQTVVYRFRFQGLTTKNELLHPRIDVALIDAQEQVVSSKAGVVDTTVPIKANEPPVVTLTNKVTPQAPGTYRLKLTATDLHSGKSIPYSQGLTITAP